MASSRLAPLAALLLLMCRGITAYRTSGGPDIVLAHGQKEGNSSEEQAHGQKAGNSSQGTPAAESVFDVLWGKAAPDNRTVNNFSKVFHGVEEMYRSLQDAELGRAAENGENRSVIAIVGAGSAGLMAALEAHFSGAEVTVFEQRSTDFVRNNVLALDPMIMRKLEWLGVKEKLFSSQDALPSFADAKAWGKACLTNDALAKLKEDEYESATQRDIKCSEGEGSVTKSGYGFIRTKCLEKALLGAVRAQGIPVVIYSALVGVAVDGETGEMRYALLRSSTDSSAIGPKGKEILFRIDALVLAVGASVGNQIKQEFRKWQLVPRACAISTKHCPGWLLSGAAGIAAVRRRADWRADTFDALDMDVVHKALGQPRLREAAADRQVTFHAVMSRANSMGYMGLPSSATLEALTEAGEAVEAWLVGLRDDVRSCKNWIEKTPIGIQAAEATLTEEQKKFVADTDHELLEKDHVLATKYTWGLKPAGIQKLSFAMTGLFMSLKAADVNWTSIHKNAVWNASSEKPHFEEIGETWSGRNWLGNSEAKDMQQVRIFANRCLTYITIGLSHKKALDLTANDEVDSLEHDVESCVSESTRASGCDGMTGVQAEEACQRVEAYARVPACGSNQACSQEKESEQIKVLERLARTVGLTGPLMRGDFGQDAAGGKPRHTFFVVRLWTLGPMPASGEPLFVIGDAGHNPNFLSGCGVVGGQNDAYVVGRYARAESRRLSKEAHQKLPTCAGRMLELVDGLVLERSCKYSDCHEHDSMHFQEERLLDMETLSVREKSSQRRSLVDHLDKDCKDVLGLDMYVHDAGAPRKVGMGLPLLAATALARVLWAAAV